MGIGRILLAGLVGGLLAGTIDIGAACLIFHAPPDRVLHAVAAGLIGHDAAVKGGLQTALLGAFLQALISVVAAWIYCFAAARLLPVLLSQWLISGILFGGAVNLFLTHIVGPLAHASMAPFASYYWFANLIANMLTFGPVIAFVASRMLRPAR